MTLWWWEHESGSGHLEEEESAKLVTGGENTLVLCVEYRKQTFIRQSTETRHEFYEIEAARLAELIRQHGKKVSKPS